jgi:hypothetical protein
VPTAPAGYPLLEAAFNPRGGKEKEAGVKLGDLCRRHGISEQTYQRWKAKYGGLEVNEARRLKQLEDENLSVPPRP